MTRAGMQAAAVQRVVRRLRARGHAARWGWYGTVFVGDRPLQLEVRAAHEHARGLTVRVHGKCYHYRYGGRLHFNRHQHGRRQHADLWVLVNLTTGQTSLVPDHEGGKTITHHRGRGPSRDVWTRYLERWDLVAA